MSTAASATVPCIAIVQRAAEPAHAAAGALMSQLALESIALPAVGDAGVSQMMEELAAAREASFAVVVAGSDLTTPGDLLQLGFLLGAIGPQRLALLVSGSPQLPPQLQGIPAYPLDEGGLWRLLLARQMRQAGLPVDLNKAV